MLQKSQTVMMGSKSVGTKLKKPSLSFEFAAQMSQQKEYEDNIFSEQDEEGKSQSPRNIDDIVALRDYISKLKTQTIALYKENSKLKSELAKIKKQYQNEIPKLNKVITELKLKIADGELLKDKIYV